MTNLEATSRICNAIVNTFYPDKGTVEYALFNAEIDASADAKPKDVDVFRVAIRLVKGYVESSRSEGGLSTSVMSEEAIRESLASWCADYGLDAEDELADYFRIIEDGSKLW